MTFYIPLVEISQEGHYSTLWNFIRASLLISAVFRLFIDRVHYVRFKSLFWQYLAECDEVVLMKDGQIAEHGTHAQLMARGRDYATLFTSVQQEVQFATTPGENHKVTHSCSALHRLFHNSWSVACKGCCFRNVNSFLASIFYEVIDLWV